MSTNSESPSAPALNQEPFFVCLQNEGYEISLEPRKLYEALPDADAKQHGQLRIIDESGEDYLYPEKFFSVVDLPKAVREAVLSAK